MNFLFVAVVVAFSSAFHPHSAVDANVGRIFNGQNAVSGQFPYAVRMEIRDASNDEFLCGGSLIGHTWVLTAAHCLQEFHIMILYLGTLTAQDSVAAFFLNRASVTFYPHWNAASGSHDIALVRIPHTDYCDGIAPIKLPQLATSHPTYVNQAAVICGWGMLSDTARLPDNEPIQWANVVVTSAEYCRIFYGNSLQEDFELCTNASNLAGPCMGDSGGPVVAASTGELIGVIQSSSNVSCVDGTPAIHSRVTYYLEWIKLKTGIWY